ncbi:MAG TPA: glutathione peroxidase [Flavobacteriales bacterium]|nr:glutathione peroxidase [Flavobacteriales bacterium]
MRTTNLLLFPLVLVLSCFNAVQVGPVTIPLDEPPAFPTMSFYDLSATDIHGELVKMDRYKGHKLIVVNTASECGFTPQYQQLEELYEKYKDKGLVILGFPCNDFGGQEPGTEGEIETFCQKNYGVTFPLMAKVEVKGEAQHAIYHWLTNRSENGVMDAVVKWNFHKFLINEEGQLVKSVGSSVEPGDEVIVGWIEGK